MEKKNENNSRITYIYGLYEVGKEDEIRYVGKTDNPNKRLRDHRNDKRTTSYKSCWVKSVLKRESDIGIKIIAEVPRDNWKEHEIFYISEYRINNNLTNLTSGGDGMRDNIYNKTYQECKDWIKDNKPDIKKMIDYKVWSKSDDFPDFLPKAPDRVFNNWVNWGDFLSTGNTSFGDRIKFYMSYDEAKLYLKSNYDLKDSVDFRKIVGLPITIPKKPFNIYKEWKGWEDFLGYKMKSRKKGLTYLSYEDAKNWIKENLGTITAREYRELSKNGKLPIFISKKPERYYKGLDWVDYLNTKKKNKSYYLPFEEARKIVSILNIESRSKWRIWYKTRPIEYERVPNNPDTLYKSNWIGWGYWFGK